jgi:transposase
VTGAAGSAGTANPTEASPAAAAVDALGRLLALAVLPGARPGLDAAPALPAALPGVPGRVVADRGFVVADRGFPAARFRNAAASLGAEPCVPAHPTHPPAPYDRSAHARREVVERLWGRMKEWRGAATRYDKAASSYRAGVLLAATLDRLRS